MIFWRGVRMRARNKKSKRFGLLEMPKNERNRLIKEIREKLQHKTSEAKLWRSLLEAENLIINGNIVYKNDQPLNNLHF